LLHCIRYDEKKKIIVFANLLVKQSIINARITSSFFAGANKEAKKHLAKSNSSAAFCWLHAVIAVIY